MVNVFASTERSSKRMFSLLDVNGFCARFSIRCRDAFAPVDVTSYADMLVSFAFRDIAASLAMFIRGHLQYATVGTRIHRLPVLISWQSYPFRLSVVGWLPVPETCFHADFR